VKVLNKFRKNFRKKLSETPQVERKAQLVLHFSTHAPINQPFPVSRTRRGMDCFLKKGERGVLRGLFESASTSDSSSEGDEEDEKEDDGEDVSCEFRSSGLEVDDQESSNGIVAHRFSLECNKYLGEIKVFQDKRRGIAFQLWPAAASLCDYLERNETLVLDLLLSSARRVNEVDSPPERGLATELDINVLELGAGVGLCGIFVAKLWGSERTNTQLRVQSVLLTDLPEAMESLNDNIKLNGLTKEKIGDGGDGEDDVGNSVSSVPLSWGCEDEATLAMSRLNGEFPTLVLAADCVYWECLFAPLVSTLKFLCSKGCVVMMCHTRRWKKDGRFFAFCKRFLGVQVAHEVVETKLDEQTGQMRRIVTRLYIITRK